MRENFRYGNGLVAIRQPVTVVVRGGVATVPLFAAETGSEARSNPMSTDGSGNVFFYVESGSYDFLALGARIPFDVEPDFAVEVGPDELDQVTDLVLQELELPDLVLLYANAKAGI